MPTISSIPYPINCLRFQPEDAEFLPDVLHIKPLRDCNSTGMKSHFITYESIDKINVHETREKDLPISREEKEDKPKEDKPVRPFKLQRPAVEAQGPVEF